jgi:MFS family permease
VAGLRFLRDDRLLLAISMRSRDEDHGALGVGIVQGAFGVGATVGALLMAVVGARLPRRTTFLVCFLLCGSPRFAAMGLGAPLAVVVSLAVVGGLAAGALNPILAAVELERIPAGKRARVLAAMTAIGYGGIPLGGLLAGALIAGFGLATALFACGAVYFAATLAPLGRTWRGMDRRPAALDTAVP